MKILLLYTTIYPDFIGGVEHRNYQLALALGRQGHEVTLAGFCAALPALHPNVHILSLGRLSTLYNEGGKRSTRQALRFAATVARLDLSPYDVVETPSVPYIHLPVLAARCALAGKPLLVTWYEYWGDYWREYVGPAKAPFYQAFEWATAQLGDRVNATSELTRSRLADARRPGGEPGGEERAEVDLVPCGLEVAEVTALASPAAAAAGEPAAPLVYAGRLLEHKRIDLLLRAVALLAGDPRVERGVQPGGPLLEIFGEGPEHGRLVALAGELGIAERVVFRGHAEESATVWRQLARARVAVQPSAREGFGLFPLEAMALAVPVVYCQSPESAVSELVRDGVEGLAVAPEPEALAAALAGLLGDDAEHRRLSENAVARAAGYDWAAIARRIAGICAGLIART